MQKKNKFQLILGSQSPRRKELLQWTFIPFKIVTSDIEEVSDKTDVAELVQDLAYQKAKHVYDKVISEYNNPVVLGADTIVVLGDEVLGKPKDREEAQNTLLKAHGKIS
jgi:septum formation protein